LLIVDWIAIRSTSTTQNQQSTINDQQRINYQQSKINNQPISVQVLVQ